MHPIRKQIWLWLTWLFQLTAIVLQATPFGVAVGRLRSAGGVETTVYLYHSYFSSVPALTYNVFPMISALCCAASAILLSLRLFRPQAAEKYGKAILTLIILSVIASGITYGIAPTGVSAAITGILAAAIAAYAVAGRKKCERAA